MSESNIDFMIQPQLQFSQDENGLEYIEINNPLATAKIALQGGHIMTWQPKSQAEPVLWLSSNARYVKGRSIRGGIPVCWPWFGAHPTDSTLCPHGFARVIPWQLVDADTLRNGATRLFLQMMETAESRRQLSYPHLLSMTITIGETLKIDLATTNKASHPFVVGEAFHTYFNVSDISNVHVKGLEDALYSDKVFGYERRVEKSDVRFNGEFDRVYLNTTADCTIEDTGLNRQIRISKSGSQSTVVWTPWADKSEQMGDMGAPDEWRKMVCVETANALENAVVISPSRTHVLSVEYSVETL
ncbi:MAG TPA: D-hexose-6-phosphate mutarotase [Methylotenera sp.]|nr:D-hexose-6-phosphate mutarotase [Methylotenera sp.]HPH05652.1 D-hexose-6-phosphate mutarotase [Methylotenera sp.]HPN01332.1 D-hexose-6-phosphate mutarotase [Methylotenera sp.]